MTEPLLFDIPISTLFLYFLWYSFLGWAIETAWCSFKARHFVYRGFLAGPICPIYGAGALIMILFLEPLSDHPVLLYVTACLVMSAWEYLVAWLLETATHVKYWDYSHLPFNLHGRICLSVSMWWGVLANFALRVLHPATQELFAWLVIPARWWVAGALAGILLADAVTTVRRLAIATRMLEMAEQARQELAVKQQELRRQLAELAETRGSFTEQSWSELTEQAKEALAERAMGVLTQRQQELLRQTAAKGAQAKEELAARQQELQLASRQLAETARLKAALAAMELRHSDLVAQAARQSRRFRSRYQLTTDRYQDTLDRIREQAARLKDSLTPDRKGD